MELHRIGTKIYGVCPNCANIVRINKPVFGSLHVCTTDDEKREYKREIAAEREAKNLALRKCKVNT